jgi:hypothetical protein
MNKLTPLIAAIALPLVSHGQESRCTLRLSVHVWPDVEYAADPRFLRTLAGNPAYNLVFVRTAEDADTELLQLSGPPDSCQDRVAVMKMNPRIVGIEVVDNDDDNDP